MLENIRKYNFWDGKEFDLGFPRVEYLQRLSDACGNRLVKVIVGQRRAGKSYVLRQLAEHIINTGVPKENILYINKEYIEYDSVATADDLQKLFNDYVDTLKPHGRVFVFIDEIQNIEGWEHFVNSHSQDFVQQTELFISGSNSDLLSGELSTLLSGRFIEVEVLPFSFSEYTDMHGKEKNRQTYIEYLSDGMLPELFHLHTAELRRHYVDAVKNTVMLRDIVQRYQVKDVVLLEDLFRYVVCNAGRLFSVNNIVNYINSQRRRTSNETVAAYLGYLNNAFLIHRAERYNIAGKEVLSGNAKYYSNDLAYYNYLYRGFAYGMGSLLENAVYLELRRKGYQVYVGVDGQREVDFVGENNDAQVYLQVCWQTIGDEKTLDREYAPLIHIRNQYPKYLVTLDDVRLPNNNGVQHLFPWEVSEL